MNGACGIPYCLLEKEQFQLSVSLVPQRLFQIDSPNR